jgi:hypothetical protein
MLGSLKMDTDGQGRQLYEARNRAAQTAAVNCLCHVHTHSAISQGDELSEAARLKCRGDEDHVCPRIDPVSKACM